MPLSAHDRVIAIVAEDFRERCDTFVEITLVAWHAALGRGRVFGARGEVLSGEIGPFD